MSTPQTSIKQLREANWGKVRSEVLNGLYALESIAWGLEPNELNDKIANDLIIPAMHCIGDFCTRVKTVEDNT